MQEEEGVGTKQAAGISSSLAVGMAGASHGHLEVGGGLVLQLVGQRMDLEPVQSETNTPVYSTSCWREGREDLEPLQSKTNNTPAYLTPCWRRVWVDLEPTQSKTTTHQFIQHHVGGEDLEPSV